MKNAILWVIVAVVAFFLFFRRPRVVVAAPARTAPSTPAAAAQQVGANAVSTIGSQLVGAGSTVLDRWLSGNYGGTVSVDNSGAISDASVPDYSDASWA